MATKMTQVDLERGRELALELLDKLTVERPPAAVAAAAVLLAACAQMAECGPDSAIKLFQGMYDKLMLGRVMMKDDEE